MPFTAFEREWMKSGYWAMVVTPPDRIPVTATEQGWMSAVLAMARAGDGAAATSAYAAALKRWPDNLPAAIGLANQHHARGAFADAVAVLRVAQQKHPQSVIVINNLAQALSDQGRHAEALAQIETASDPQSPFAAEVRSTRQADHGAHRPTKNRQPAVAAAGTELRELGKHRLVAIGGHARAIVTAAAYRRLRNRLAHAPGMWHTLQRAGRVSRYNDRYRSFAPCEKCTNIVQ